MSLSPIRPRTLGIASAVGAIILGASTTPAAAGPDFTPSHWRDGPPVANYHLVCNGFCINYSAVFAQVSYQGPEAAPTALPKVGQRFYLHLQTAVVYPTTLNDRYQMRLLLPAGMSTAIRSNTDVGCNISDGSTGNFKRYMADFECLDPIKVGLYDQFPFVSVANGEVANFWVPVVSSRKLTGSDSIGMVSSFQSNPLSLLPSPLYATVKPLVSPVQPSPVRSAKVSRYPHRRQAALSWQAPAINGGAPLTGYRVRISKANSATYGLWSASTARSLVFKGLRKGKKYRVQIQANNSVGHSATVTVRFRQAK